MRKFLRWKIRNWLDLCAVLGLNLMLAGRIAASFLGMAETLGWVWAWIVRTVV